MLSALIFMACAGPQDTAAGPACTSEALPAPDALPEQAAPPPLMSCFQTEQPVETAADWRDSRRPELLRLFSQYVYGFAPEPVFVSVEDLAASPGTRTVSIQYTGLPEAPPMTMTIFLPEASAPVPVLLGLNKCGNASVSADEAVPETDGWREESCPTERGGRADYWDIAAALARGVAVATVHQSDIDPDDDGSSGGVQPHAALPTGVAAGAGWGTIAAWSWGLQHARAALAQLPEIDADQIAVFGHSRRGKAALWAAAQDTGFAAVWAHQSGTAGAALTRDSTGEPLSSINVVFPHWFNDVFPAFNLQVERLPVDQHMLVALAAPRRVLLTDGDEDFWANPDGAQQSAALAAPAWDLLGGDPPAWVLRPGEHNVSDQDWKIFLDFFAP